MPFWPQFCKSEAILSKTFPQGHTDWSVPAYGKQFHPGYRDLVNRASPVSHRNFYEGKSDEARSLAHMKRP